MTQRHDDDDGKAFAKQRPADDEPKRKTGKTGDPEPTPFVATKAEAQSGIAECLKRWPVTEGYLSKTVEYVAAGV